MSDLADGASDLERRVAALCLFRPGGSAGRGLGAAQRALPLEPALANAWCVGVKGRRGGVGDCNRVWLCVCV